MLTLLDEHQQNSKRLSTVKKKLLDGLIWELFKMLFWKWYNRNLSFFYANSFKQLCCNKYQQQKKTKDVFIWLSI